MNFLFILIILQYFVLSSVLLELRLFLLPLSCPEPFTGFLSHREFLPKCYSQPGLPLKSGPENSQQGFFSLLLSLVTQSRLAALALCCLQHNSMICFCLCCSLGSELSAAMCAQDLFRSTLPEMPSLSKLSTDNNPAILYPFSCLCVS